jgi:putative hydrolase of the HAD superfamily
MILIFDLDDTLYPELTYVYSGFKAVAKYLEHEFGWKSTDVFDVIQADLLTLGRGAVFDGLLKSKGTYSGALVKRCVSVYRNHDPEISLNTDANDLLANLVGPLFLVTDGNKMVQAKKVRALGLDPLFRRIFITHRFGIHNSKPSTHCFRLIHDSLNCDWSDMVYIGDNPAKDFVNLKPLGMKTVRILTGSYANVSAAPNFDADFHIDSLNEITDLFSMG